MLLAGWPAFGQLPASDTRMMSTEHAMYFSGEVVLEDGSTPPEVVLIQRVCNGRAHNEGWTDLKGRFSFKVEGGESKPTDADATQASAPPSDVMRPFGNASQYTQPVTSSLRDCELQAVLAGFESSTVNMAVKSTLESGHVGKIILRPLAHGGAAATVSMTTVAAPGNAKKAYEKGTVALRAGKWDTAEGEFTKAVGIYPPFAIAWYELGLLRQRKNDLPGAVDAWKTAVKRDPKYGKPYMRLTALADSRQDWAESEKYASEWIQLDPQNFPAAYFFHAIASARLNRMELAEHSAREGLRVDKDKTVPRLNYVLGLILVEKHENQEAAKCFRAYLELAPNAKDAAAVRQEIAKLEGVATR